MVRSRSRAALSVAIGAAFLDDLAGALASGASAIDGEETLLIDNLAAAAAGLASSHTGSLLRTGSVARFAIFLARDADLGVDARGRFLKRQRHVVAKVGATLHPATSTATATASACGTEEIFEAEEVAKNVVEILEDGAVEVGLRAGASQPGMTVGVVDLALVWVAEDAVRLGAFAETDFGLFLVFRIAVGVPLEGRLAIRRFDFLDRGGLGDAQDFVVVALV